MREIERLEVTEGWTATKIRLTGRTKGCDCCADFIDGQGLEEARALAARWVEELTATLAKAHELVAALESVQPEQWETQEEW